VIFTALEAEPGLSEHPVSVAELLADAFGVLEAFESPLPEQAVRSRAAAAATRAMGTDLRTVNSR